MLTYSQLQMMYNRLSKEYKHFQDMIAPIFEELPSENLKIFIKSSQKEVKQCLQQISYPQVLKLNTIQELQLAKRYPNFFEEYSQALSDHYNKLKKMIACLYLLEKLINKYI